MSLRLSFCRQNDVLGAGRDGAELEHYGVAFRQMEKKAKTI